MLGFGLAAPLGILTAYLSEAACSPLSSFLGRGVARLCVPSARVDSFGCCRNLARLVAGQPLQGLICALPVAMWLLWPRVRRRDIA
jgi:hypothetical protein